MMACEEKEWEWYGRYLGVKPRWKRAVAAAFREFLLLFLHYTTLVLQDRLLDLMPMFGTLTVYAWIPLWVHDAKMLFPTYGCRWVGDALHSLWHCFFSPVSEVGEAVHSLQLFPSLTPTLPVTS